MDDNELTVLEFIIKLKNGYKRCHTIDKGGGAPISPGRLIS